MPKPTANQIIDDAAALLQDATNTRWSRAELFAHVNNGQRDLCMVKADAYVLNAAFTLVAGTKQTLPDGGLAFVRVACNLSPSDVRGRVPREMPLAVLDRQNPNWHSAPASATVMEVAFDPRDPKHFYTSPPQPATPGKVELVYCATPPDIAVPTAEMTLDAIYKTALVSYVVYKAYLIEGEFQNNAGAATHRAEFLQLLGAKDRAESTSEPS